MWSQPQIDQQLKDMAKQLGCCWIGHVLVDPDLNHQYDNCHNNVLNHVQQFGGEPVLGYYFISGFGTIQAVRHSVWYDHDNLIDVTPYRDKRKYIVFGKSESQVADYKISNCYLHGLAKYLKHETETMYYVYELVDPRDNQTFYVGKGTGRRAYTHLWEKPETFNAYKQAKIDSIRKQGLEPQVRFIAENIVDEQFAYDIERELIKKYGRKGYEKNGILTNVCIDNRPPNHKGKTYEEIYGDRAEEQKKIRAELQRALGGYGPKKHSMQTRKKISQSVSGPNNPRYGKPVSESTRQKISNANKGRKRYTNARLIYIEGMDKFLYLNDLKEYCIKHNLSAGTFYKQIYNSWPTSRKGKNTGLRARFATESEVMSYNKNFEL